MIPWTDTWEKSRAARAARNNGNLAALQRVNGPCRAVMFADRVHGRSGVDAHFLPDGFKSRTQCQTVDDRGQHTHLIALHAVKTTGGTTQTAEDISAANDDGYFDAEAGNLLYLCCILLQAGLVYTILFLSHEALATEFEKDSFIL